MYCYQCGQRIADEVRVCPNCGALIPYDKDGKMRCEGEQRAEEKPAEAARFPEPEQPEEPSYRSYTADPNTASGYNYSTYNSNYSTTYTPITPSNPKADGFAVAGLVAAIVSALCCCFPYVGAPVALLGIIFSALGMKSEIRKSMAVTALVISIIFFLLNAVLLVMAIYGTTHFDEFAQIYKEEFGIDLYEYLK